MVKKSMHIIFVILVLLLSGCTSNESSNLVQEELKQIRLELDAIKTENTGLRETLASYEAKENEELIEKVTRLEEEIASLKNDELSRIERLEWIIKKLPGTEIKMVYINDYSQQDNLLYVNEIEWVTTEERAQEIGIKYDGMPNGFYIYDEKYQNNKVKLAKDFRCYLLNEATRVEKSQDDLWNHLAHESKSEFKYPFIIYIIGDKIIEVTQQYLP